MPGWPKWASTSLSQPLSFGRSTLLQRIGTVVRRYHMKLQQLVKGLEDENRARVVLLV